MYVISDIFMSVSRLDNQEVVLHHIEEVMNKPRTVWVGM